MCCQAPLTENFIYNLISLFYLFFSESYCIIFKRHGELAEWSKAHDWKSCLRGTVTRVQIPNSPPKNTAENDTFSAVFFYPSRRLGISSPHEVWWISSALWAVYHHASACIFLRLDDILARKRDILVFGRMICNSLRNWWYARLTPWFWLDLMLWKLHNFFVFSRKI